MRTALAHRAPSSAIELMKSSYEPGSPPAAGPAVVTGADATAAGAAAAAADAPGSAVTAPTVDGREMLDVRVCLGRATVFGRLTRRFEGTMEGRAPLGRTRGGAAVTVGPASATTAVAAAAAGLAAASR